jgi:sugar lactone lactonase YvrE
VIPLDRGRTIIRWGPEPDEEGIMQSPSPSDRGPGRAPRRELLVFGWALFLVVLAAAALAGAFFAGPAAAVVNNQQYGLLNQIGGPGSGAGQFGSGSNPGPYGVAVDAAGRVFVLDPHDSDDRVDVFSPDGTLLTSFGPYGSVDGTLGSPYGIAVSPAGVVFVIDTWRADAARVQSFASSDGGATYASTGHVTIGAPSGAAFQIAADGAGCVYVTDNHDAVHRVLKYRVSDGALIAEIGVSGGGDQLLASPKGVAVSADGLDLYVCDNAVVKRYHSTDGAAYTYAQSLSGPAGTLAGPWGVAVDGSGAVYVTDISLDAVVKFSAAGDVVTSWGESGSGDYGFAGPRAVAVSATGCVYVAAPGSNATPEQAAQNHRVMRFARDLTPPVSTVAGVPAGWTRAASVALTFSADDPLVADEYRAGYGHTEFLDGVDWISLLGSEWVVDAEGVTTLAYRAVDGRGNADQARSLTVRIDRTAPSPRPLAAVTVMKGKKARLRYRVDDLLSPQAKVRVKIRKGAKTVRTLSLGTKATGRELACSWRCKLARGRYSWTVYATDLAGNVQVRTVNRSLVVR